MTKITTADEARAAIANANPGEMQTAIIEKFNCREVEISDQGEVWIALPMRGHWLADDDLIALAQG